VTEPVEEINSTVSSTTLSDNTADQTITIDFTTLQKKNQDIYAWITVPGTEIDYPILQSPTDDTYYLEHTAEKTKGLPGAIYTEMINSKEFDDYNTVIYGHNMKNGSMFAGLHEFADKKFFEENQTIQIQLPDQVLNYTIFAAYKTDDTHIMMTYDFTDELVRTDYLNNISEIRSIGSNIDPDIEVTPEDKIITLETCIAGDFHGRYVVQAVLNDPDQEEQVEDITEETVE
ncbi:MAG: class B sortase, partial [Lachnospiraceae bacterium]|nr:class B sortase [Lachnospiraceae bacterium]